MEEASEVRVLVIDDDYYARSDLVARLARHSQIRVVGDAAGPAQALELVRRGACEAAPDVVLLDLAYEQPGFSATPFIAELLVLLPAARVLGLSAREDEALALDAVRAGACGVLWKNELRLRICQAVLDTHTGRCVFTPGVARALLGRVQHLPGAAGIVAAPATPALTPRLEQVARLWCEAGLGAREIAEELHLREQTVRGYIKQIYQVLGVAEDGPAANPRQRAYEVRAEGEPGEG